MMGEKNPGYRAALGLRLYLAGATILGLSGCAPEHLQIQESYKLGAEAERGIAAYREMRDNQKEWGMPPGKNLLR